MKVRADGRLAKVVGGDSLRPSRFHTARGVAAPVGAWRHVPVELWRRFVRATGPVPWMTPVAVAYLSDVVTQGTKILELGSGSSTLWCAEQGASVVSVETDEAWHLSITAKVAEARYLRCRLLHVTPSGLTEYLRELSDEEFDVVIVDHSETRHATRLDSLAAARDTVRRGGLLLLDDSDRPENREAQAVLAGWSCVRLTGIKGDPLLAVETSVFTRPDRGKGALRDNP